MAHFALSMLILVAAVALVWRARVYRGDRARGAEDTRAARSRRAAVRGPRPFTDRVIVLYARGLVVLGALTLFAGTAATAAGPHAGGSPGQKINRLSFDGRGTMDFVIHRHGEIALTFGLAAVGLWWLARRRGADERVRRPLTVLCWLLALQGAVGLDQYKTHLPTELVWVHVVLACCSWIAVIWAALAAGPLPARTPADLPEPPEDARERPTEAPLVAASPLEFPGN
jgi:cytochrome c oxidase assembly protein subunit 15